MRWLMAMIFCSTVQAHSWVSFEPCGFKGRPEDIGNPEMGPKMDRAPNLKRMMVHPSSVVGLVEAPYSGKGLKCTKVILVNGNAQWVVGSGDEIRKKLQH